MPFPMSIKTAEALEEDARSSQWSPEICAAVSTAISLKRIADALTICDKYGLTGSASIAQAITDGMREGRP